MWWWDEMRLEGSHQKVSKQGGISAEGKMLNPITQLEHDLPSKLPLQLPRRFRVGRLLVIYGFWTFLTMIVFYWGSS